jgi:hypothetical protein
MMFLQYDHLKKGCHLIGCRTSTAVLSFESEVDRWNLTYELLNRVVARMSKPAL